MQQSLTRNARRNRQRRANRSMNAAGMGRSNDIRYSFMGSSVTTDANGLVGASYALVPGLGATNSVGARIESCYATGVYRPGTSWTWVPNLGSTANGRIYVAYIENPETWSKLQAQLGTGDFINAVTRQGNVVSHQVSKEFKYSPVARPRKMSFATNETINQTDTVQLEASFQGGIVAVIIGAPATTVAGTFRLDAIVHLEEFNPAGYT